MQLHQLSIFVQVAEKKSFSKAAEEIFLSQSTVSTHISSLEKHFGQKIFDRLGKEVVLTPFGERLYYWSRELLKLQETALWDLKEWTGRVEGTLRLGAGTVPAQYLAPFLISQFSLRYPGISFTLSQNSSEIVAESLLKNYADLGILGEKYFTERLEYITLLEEDLVLITPQNLSFKEPLSLHSLLHYQFILRKPGSGTQAVLEKMLRQAGISLTRLRASAYFDNVQSIKQAVREGMGLAIISEIAALDYQQSGYINAYRLKELKEKRTFYFAYNKKKTQPPYLFEFITYSKSLLSLSPGHAAAPLKS